MSACGWSEIVPKLPFLSLSVSILVSLRCQFSFVSGTGTLCFLCSEHFSLGFFFLVTLVFPDFTLPFHPWPCLSFPLRSLSIPLSSFSCASPLFPVPIFIYNKVCLPLALTQVNFVCKFMLNWKISMEKVWCSGKKPYLCIRFQGSPLLASLKRVHWKIYIDRKSR